MTSRYHISMVRRITRRCTGEQCFRIQASFSVKDLRRGISHLSSGSLPAFRTQAAWYGDARSAMA